MSDNVKKYDFNSEFWDKKILALYNLKSIVRYNNRFHLTSETVAEHSFYVALIGLLICDDLGVSEDVKHEVIIKALLHDMPETVINDITHDVKEKLHLEEYLANFENEYYKKYFEKYADLMKRQDTLADEIMWLADIMSVKQFSSHEIDIGNSSAAMKEININAIKRICEKSVNISQLLKK